MAKRRMRPPISPEEKTVRKVERVKKKEDLEVTQEEIEDTPAPLGSNTQSIGK
jgi:hypothetical protein